MRKVLQMLLLMLPLGTFAQLDQKRTEKTEDCWVEVTDTITMDKLLDVAVKYFYISLTEEGHFGGSLCVGFSLLDETQPERNKELELFCAGAIMENSQGEDGLHAVFIEAVNEVATMNLGLNKEERLLRAQGALFMLMKLNPKLRETLLSEYEKQQHMLHFYLLSTN